jgi:hypothetical protein
VAVRRCRALPPFARREEGVCAAPARAPWILAADGLEALAGDDSPAVGGDGDGAITNADQIYRRLRLWIDANADGVSASNDLHTLRKFDVQRIELDAERTWLVDANGNVAFLTSTFSGRRRHGNWFDFFLVGIR